MAEEKSDEEDSPTEITEEVETSLQQNKPNLSDQEGDELPQEEIEIPIKQESSPTPDEEPEELGENISKSSDERVPRDTQSLEIAFDEPLEATVPDGAPENPSAEDFEMILLEQLNDDEVSDENDDDIDKDDNVMDKVSEEDYGSEKDDDVVNRDDDDVMDEDFPGVTTEEESTVKTVILEKTHSEVTVTEVTTTKYPPSKHTPASEIPETPKDASGDDENDYVIIPIDMAKSDDVIKPAEVETVEGIPDDQPICDEQPTMRDEQPTTHDDSSIPLLIITKEPGRKPSSNSDSEQESSDSDSSTSDADDERTDNDVGRGVEVEQAIEKPDQPTETVFGIVDISYEKTKDEDTTIESSVDVQEPENDVLIVVLPKNVQTYEDGPTPDDLTPKQDTTPLEEDIAVPIDEGSSTSSDDEQTDDDKHVSKGSFENTVETIVVEKTSTQLSTTITKITAPSDAFNAAEDVPVTFVRDNEPQSEEPESEVLPTSEGNNIFF